MKKIFTFQSITIFVIIACLAVIFIFVMRSCSTQKVVTAYLSKTDLVVGEKLTYADSTQGAQQWLWEFGNGDTFFDRSGQYVFTETGRYQIRLTVNNKWEKYLLVRVREAPNEAAMGLVGIDAPKEALQGEYVMFKGIGQATQWRWVFDQEGSSYEQNALFAFSTPGMHRVTLKTDMNQYEVDHWINIKEVYAAGDSTDVLSVAGNDIKVKLQAISDGKAFNPNYNAILKYFSSDEHAVVTINNNKYNDLYSYCQGLKLTGRANKTRIENVLPEVDPQNPQKIIKMIVIQYDDKH